MWRSFLIGLAAGQRGITPLAAVATASRRGEIDTDLPLQKLMLNPVVAAGASTFAAAEMVGDKMKIAPDRTVAVGLVVRGVTAAYAGAALAPRDKRLLGAAIAVGTALTTAFAGLAARKWAMQRYDQTATGFVEDAAVFAGAMLTANPTLIPQKTLRNF